jgi:hypothetical protein
MLSGMEDGFVDSEGPSNLALAEPNPEDRRPRGALAWMLGIAVWLVILGVLGLLVWLLS